MNQNPFQTQAATTPLPDLFEYLDYRAYLKDYFEANKNSQVAWSYQVFAEQMGFKAKDFLFRIMKGEKNLSQASILKMTEGLKLNSLQTQYFDTLVKCNQSHNIAERNLYFNLLNTIKTQGRTTHPVQRLRQDQFQFYSKWYHSVIRSLIEMFGFQNDFKQLAASLSPRITAREAESSVMLLQKLGLIRKNETGHFETTQKTITTGKDTSHILIPAYHKATIELSAAALENIPVLERDMSNLTLGISASTFKHLTERLREFRKEILERAEKDEDADRVYHLNLHLYPLSKPKLKKGDIG
jgi:uncharacterized protein (TIGR02147 family)